MRLIRYGQIGQERTGVQIEGKNYDTSGFGQDYNEQFFESDGINRLKAYVEANKGKLTEVSSSERLSSPVARPSKILCIGLNYADHAKETGAKTPEEPIIFMKSSTSLCGPNDDIIIPKNSVKTDWEVELAVVIGKKASYVEESEAADYIAGYT